MYDVHLWIVLAESTVESDYGALKDKIRQLESLVSEKLDIRPIKPIHQVNVLSVFQCSLSYNHRGDAHERLKSIISWINENLPGSHGLVYWYDDEIPGHDNFDGYHVMVIARGKVIDRYDPFLSPTIPTIED